MNAASDPRKGKGATSAAQFGAALSRTRAADPEGPGDGAEIEVAYTPRPEAPRVKPVRITVDLAPDLHNQLKVWSAQENVKLSEVVRALSSRMLADPALATQIRADIRKSASQ